LTEYPYFPIFANINDSIQNLSNVLIAGTMVITSGAYLYDQIDAPSTNQIIYLTPKNISLSAYVRNLVDGTSNPNNTAYNVGFNWSIPNSVLTRLLDSSNLSVNYSILNNTAKQYLPLGNLTLQLNPTNLGTFLASDIGNFTISVTASGYRNSTGNLTPILESGNNTVVTNSINLIFQCYQPKDNVTVSACGSLDGDYVAPSSGGSTATGGGGGSSGGQGSIVSKADYTIVRGIQNELTVPFTNKDQNVSLKNLKFEVSGNIAKYIAIIPENLSELSPGQTVNIKLQITSPGYLPLGLQQITLRISGKIGASDYNENRQINIQINSMSTADAKSLLDEMQSLLAQMQKINLTTINLDPLLNESYVYFNNFQYDNLSADHDSLKAQATAGINAFNTINQLQTLISDAQVKGIDVSDAARLLQLAQLSLERGDYTEAQARSVDARNAYALETAGKFESIGYFLNANKGTIGLSAFVLAIITFTSYKLARLASLKNKLRKLKEEELILTQLIKLAQVQTFKEKRMEMEEYRESMLQYENKMAQVIEDIIDTETEIAHVLKFTSLENKLKSEKVRIIDLIKQLQTDYLKKGIIEAKAYELKLESYNKRLGEIEEKLAEIEAKQALKQARKEIALAK